jgi:hypothetical protein
MPPCGRPSLGVEWLGSAWWDHKSSNQIQSRFWPISYHCADCIWQEVAMDSQQFYLGLPCPKGWPAHRVGSLWPSFTLLDTPCYTEIGICPVWSPNVWARSLSTVIIGEVFPLPYDAKWPCINLGCPSQQQQQQLRSGSWLTWRSKRRHDEQVKWPMVESFFLVMEIFLGSFSRLKH